jgi:hypothetical protein
MLRRFCPKIQDYLAECYTQCEWILRDKCTYDALIVKEFADLKMMREATKITDYRRE